MLLYGRGQGQSGLRVRRFGDSSVRVQGSGFRLYDVLRSFAGLREASGVNCDKLSSDPILIILTRIYNNDYYDHRDASIVNAVDDD